MRSPSRRTRLRSANIVSAFAQLAVTVFFTVSAFVLYRPFVAARAAGAPEPALGQLPDPPLVRVLPAYWLLLTVLALFGRRPGVFSHDWWRYYFLLQIYTTDPLLAAGGIAPAWTLAVEVTFYFLLVGVVVLMRRRWRGREHPAARWRGELLVPCAFFALGAIPWILALDDPGPGLPAHDAGRDRGLVRGRDGVRGALGARGAWDRPARPVRALRDHPALCWAVGAGTVAWIATVPRFPLPDGPPVTLTPLEGTLIVLAGVLAGMLCCAPILLGARPSGRIVRSLSSRRWWLGWASSCYGTYLIHHGLMMLLLGAVARRRRAAAQDVRRVRDHLPACRGDRRRELVPRRAPAGPRCRARPAQPADATRRDRAGHAGTISRMRRSLTFACVVAVLGTVGCGEGELAPKRGLPANTVLVTQEDVDKYPPRSPQRTLMSWWRSMQYTDSRGYLALLATPLRKARLADRAYRVQLPIIARQVDDAVPHITRVSAKGDNATVYAELEFRQLVGADRYATTRVAQAFAMVRERGDWRDLRRPVRRGRRPRPAAGAGAAGCEGRRPVAGGRLHAGTAALPAPLPSPPATATPGTLIRGRQRRATARSRSPRVAWRRTPPPATTSRARTGDRPRRRPGRGPPVVPARNGEDVDRRQAGAPQARAEARRREVRQVLGARERRPAQPQPGRHRAGDVRHLDEHVTAWDEPPGDVAQHRDRVAGVLEDMPQADDVGGLAGGRILEQAGGDRQPVRLPGELAERRRRLDAADAEPLRARLVEEVASRGAGLEQRTATHMRAHPAQAQPCLVAALAGVDLHFLIAGEVVVACVGAHGLRPPLAGKARTTGSAPIQRDPVAARRLDGAVAQRTTGHAPVTRSERA